MSAPVKPVVWTRTDGWILMSVLMAQGMPDQKLPNLITAADALNHAIPTAKELSQALTKLVRCGVVVIETGRYQISPEHMASLKRAGKSRGGLFSSPEKGLKWLKKIDLPPKSAKRITISGKQMDAGYEVYHKAVET